jgi:tetratricopeptide (TPR) repeat protein
LRLSLLGAIALTLLFCADANKWALAQNGASPGCVAETRQKTFVSCLKLIAASENQVEIADALLVLCKLVADRGAMIGEIAPFCDRAVAVNPNLSAALEARGTYKLRVSVFVQEATERERLRSEVKQDFDRLVTPAPNDARTWIAQANLAMRQADWPLALSSVDKAAAIAPNDASICSLRGRIHSAMHHQDDAFADYLHCARLAPGDARALADIAQIYFEKQEYSKALDYASKVIGTGGEDGTVDALVLLGTIHLQMGDAGQAKNDFKQALAIRKFDKRALAGLEKAMGSHLPSSYDCELGQLSEETVKICSAVLEYVTDYTVVEHRAWAYLALKKYDLAAADYTTLIVSEPDWPGYTPTH